MSNRTMISISNVYQEGFRRLIYMNKLKRELGSQSEWKGAADVAIM